MGRKFSKYEVNNEGFPPNMIFHEDTPFFKIKVNDTDTLFSPEQAYGRLLKEMSDISQNVRHLGDGATHAVIGVPAYFTVSFAPLELLEDNRSLSYGRMTRNKWSGKRQIRSILMSHV